MKKCSKCGQDKDENEFTKNSAASDGLHTWCKLCQKDNMRIRRGLAPTRPRPQPLIVDVDIQNTKLYKNYIFVSGDGGYKDYINACRP